MLPLLYLLRMVKHPLGIRAQVHQKGSTRACIGSQQSWHHIPFVASHLLTQPVVHDGLGVLVVLSSLICHWNHLPNLMGTNPQKMKETWRMALFDLQRCFYTGSWKSHISSMIWAYSQRHRVVMQSHLFAIENYHWVWFPYQQLFIVGLPVILMVTFQFCLSKNGDFPKKFQEELEIEGVSWLKWCKWWRPIYWIPLDIK